MAYTAHITMRTYQRRSSGATSARAVAIALLLKLCNLTQETWQYAMPHTPMQCTGEKLSTDVPDCARLAAQSNSMTSRAVAGAAANAADSRRGEGSANEDEPQVRVCSCGNAG